MRVSDFDGKQVYEPNFDSASAEGGIETPANLHAEGRILGLRAASPLHLLLAFLFGLDMPFSL